MPLKRLPQTSKHYHLRPTLYWPLDRPQNQRPVGLVVPQFHPEAFQLFRPTPSHLAVHHAGLFGLQVDYQFAVEWFRWVAESQLLLAHLEVLQFLLCCRFSARSLGLRPPLILGDNGEIPEARISIKA